jgi:hypothetical protein
MSALTNPVFRLTPNVNCTYFRFRHQYQIPVEKAIGYKVTGGTGNGPGSFVMRAEQVNKVPHCLRE